MRYVNKTLCAICRGETKVVGTLRVELHEVGTTKKMAVYSDIRRCTCCKSEQLSDQSQAFQICAWARAGLRPTL